MLVMKPFFTLYFALFIQSISYQLWQNLFQMICFYCWWWFNLQVQSKCLKWEIHQDFPNLSGGIADYSVHTMTTYWKCDRKSALLVILTKFDSGMIS